MGFTRDTEVPFEVIITEYILLEEFAQVTLTETVLVEVIYVPPLLVFIVEIEDEVAEIPIIEEEPEEEEVVEEPAVEEVAEIPEFVFNVFSWTPPKPKKRKRSQSF